MLVVTNPPANAGDARDVGSIPGLGRSPGGRHGYPLQYSYLENPIDRGAWQLQFLRLGSHTWSHQREEGSPDLSPYQLFCLN